MGAVPRFAGGCGTAQEEFLSIPLPSARRGVAPLPQLQNGHQSARPKKPHFRPPLPRGGKSAFFFVSEIRPEPTCRGWGGSGSVVLPGSGVLPPSLGYFPLPLLLYARPPRGGEGWSKCSPGAEFSCQAWALFPPRTSSRSTGIFPHTAILSSSFPPSAQLSQTSVSAWFSPRERSSPSVLRLNTSSLVCARLLRESRLGLFGARVPCLLLS